MLTGLKRFLSTKKRTFLKVLFVANGFHDSENNCFRKIQSTTKFCNFLLVYLLPIFVNERSHIT